MCWRCMVFFFEHHNILQFKESEWIGVRGDETGLADGDADYGCAMGTWPRSVVSINAERRSVRFKGAAQCRSGLPVNNGPRMRRSWVA